MLDQNLPPQLARSFNVLFADHTIIAKRDRFKPNTPDINWMTDLGEEGGWAVLTKDRAIVRSRLEKEAFRRAGLVGFFLERSWEKRKMVEIAWRLLRQWDQMEQAYNLVAGGAAWRVRLTGKLVQDSL